MADIKKRAEKAERPTRPEQGSAPDAKVEPGASGDREALAAGRRDWARLRRLLPPMLASWAAIVAGCYYLSMSAPDPGLPAPIAALISPLESSAFRACVGNLDAPDGPTSLDAPAKASSLLFPSALAQEASPDNLPDAPLDFEQQQIPNKAAEPPADQQVQQQQQQQQQSNTTSSGFDLELMPPTGCGELGFGELVDVVMDKSGDLAWVINRYGLVYHSDDGGKTWSPQTLPDFPEGAALSAIAADDSGKSLAIAVQVPQNIARGQFRFYRSDDGGDTWRLDETLTLDAAQFTRTNQHGFNILGLAIAADGKYVLAILKFPIDATDSMTWRSDAQRWTKGSQAVEAEMVHNIRMRDFGDAAADLGATGSTPPPIGTWERLAGSGTPLSFERQVLGAGGALVLEDGSVAYFQFATQYLFALAASDDGEEVFAAETQAIVQGNVRGDPWWRMDMRPVTATPDFALRSIDVANGNQAIMAVGRHALFVSQDGGTTFFQPVLSQWPAPWFYLVLLSGPLYAFYLMRPGAPETRIVEADETKGLSDRALGLKDADALNLRAYAEGLADLLRNAETKPPLVIGVTGPWGSGKSSVMQMLSELLALKQMPIVWFNAWHHQSEEHLLASLLSNIRRQGIPGFWTRPGLRLRWRLMLQKLTPHEPIGGFLWSWFLLLLGLALLSGALALWIASAYDTVPAPAAASSGDDTSSVEFLQDLVCSEQPCKDLILALANVLPGLEIGAFLTLLLGLVPLNRLKQVALITRNFDPAKLMTSVMPSSRNPRLDEQLSFRHGFGEELRSTIGALAPYRLVIFIDDLDRCRPENVAAVLEAVNFVVSAADCYVVLGMDRAYVLRAIRQEFEKFIEMEKAERKDLSLGTPEEDKGRPRDFAEHYLEKLVNLIVSVPKMTPDGRAKLMESLASAPIKADDSAPAFDWWRWSRRSSATAAMLAALLGPALYVATMSPPVELPPAVEPGPVDAQTAQGADATGPVDQSGAVRTIEPFVAEFPGVRGDPGLARSGLGPVLLVSSAIVALVGIIWVAARAISVPANLLIRDSGAFKTTLRSVEERLASFMTTPRRAKRFVNRLRLFGAMLRSGRDDIAPAREADLDRATVQAGALHALSRELLLAQQVDATAPQDAAARAAWEETRKQAEAAQKTYREALVALYHAIDRPRRPLVDALYWRFWQLSDGATLGDQAVVKVAEAASAAAAGGTAGPSAGTDMLQPSNFDDLDDVLLPMPLQEPAQAAK